MLLDLYGEALTTKQRDYLNFYYNDDLSLSEIAENEGITRQGVRDAIKRAEALLFDMESKLKFSKKLERIHSDACSIFRLYIHDNINTIRCCIFIAFDYRKFF